MSKYPMEMITKILLQYLRGFKATSIVEVWTNNPNMICITCWCPYWYSFCPETTIGETGLHGQELVKILQFIGETDLHEQEFVRILKFIHKNAITLHEMPQTFNKKKPKLLCMGQNSILSFHLCHRPLSQITFLILFQI